jgi:hypothetical protein
MSLSSRNGAFVAALALAALLPAVVRAQQTYFIPRVSVSAEYNTNREMTTAATDDASSAYTGTLEARTGRATPRGDIELRPRVTYQEFPDRDGVDPLGYFLDLKTEYRSPRVLTSFLGKYARQDTFTAEFGTPVFDDFDPANPPLPNETGIVFVGRTREDVNLQPKISFVLTERTQLVANAGYQQVDYGASQLAGATGYESPSAGVGFDYALNQRTNIAAGPYWAHYESDDGTNETQTYGVQGQVRYEWSEISYFRAVVSFEQDDITQTDPLTGFSTDRSRNNWGLQLEGYQRHEVGGIRYSIGRRNLPSSFGSRRQIDEARVQYDRPLSPRLAFMGAVRFWRDERDSSTRISTAVDSRDRARGELSLRWLATPSIDLSGGYRYAWQYAAFSSGKAQNHTAFITLGYRGLDPRSRRR